ncbi:MAG TPA: hypothetical protein VIF62_03645 [Labilithrix sp.]
MKMGRVRACVAAALVAAVWIGCGSSSSTSGPGVDGGSTDGPLGSDANPAGCPATQPATGASCGAPSSTSCSYGCSSCRCGTEGWECEAPGCSGLTPCPIAAPTEGASCATGGGCCGGTQESPCMYPEDASTTTATCTSSVWHVMTSSDAGTD